ncbi:hypothetical protein Vretimale_1194 [Volvox reticuliferus]|uniref:EGF-like domain-containing protein n=1 Tax=Volvox reticuliferus TaxID=1737510 RepID=A0A8J4FNR1_9CHLO|nr:hypothetical protein Vretifemale_10287 [Volvox reticuliferus]GIL95117.1 hypothetical protein Vretimale_1194 [Volvox reticuliferus]
MLSFAALMIVGVAMVAHAQAPGAFYEDTKTCDPGCNKYGNCNGETGQCDCPFGLAGPTCTEKLFPACHSSHDDGTLPHYGDWYPKNCFCYKQLAAHPYSCPSYLKYDGLGFSPQAPCFYDTLLNSNLLCYRYKGIPENQQLSDSPELTDPNIEWLHVRSFPTWYETPTAAPTTLSTPDGIYRPLKECPDKCSNRGWCQSLGGNHLMEPHHDPEERWCKCHSFFQGKACEISDPIHCYRNCSGVGTCLNGWCHCKPGYWGHGCTRTKAYSSTVGWRPNHAAIKVYVYDLPSIIVHRREFNDQWSYIDLMYNAELEFTEQLLGDWSVRTENPWEAALFYVPTFTYWYTGNIGHPTYIIQHVVHHLQHLAPFFNMTGGRNHIMWATNDRGACKLQMSQLELQHPIKLVHFGQAPRHAYLQKSHMKSTGVGLDMYMGGVGSLLEPLPLPGHRFQGFPEFNAPDLMEEHEICIRPEKDVVAPNVLHNAWVEPPAYSKVWETSFVDGERVVTRKPEDPAQRVITMFFGGYTKPIMAYSQGVRQALNLLFGPSGKYDPAGPNARHDILVTGPLVDAVEVMQRSKFCLAPMGAGWGIRLTEAMVTGCVPVIIQDHIYQPLWDVVPFEEFSLRLSRTDVTDLVEHLDDVTPEQLARLQAGVEKHHRAFMWDTHYGGLAYNFTVTALKRRAISFWSGNYRKRSNRRHHLRSVS